VGGLHVLQQVTAVAGPMWSSVVLLAAANANPWPIAAALPPTAGSQMPSIRSVTLENMSPMRQRALSVELRG
jgi:hypothetical protein